MDPTKVLVAGDWHGNPVHAEYVFNEALSHGADAILQVGDFGFWEQEPQGVAFLDLCAELVVQSEIQLYWIDGNHESHTLLRERYGPGGERHKLTAEGFWEIRPGVYYIPRGTWWAWHGVTMMGLGGAYSVDKAWRLDIEEYGGMTRNGSHGPPTGPRTMWWPEEELTDEEIDLAIANSPERIDILFTHDKPRGSNPGWNRKDLPGCYGNQDKIQEVVRAKRPRLLIHGHLHYRYQDQIRAAGDSWTTVIGLDCDSERGLYTLMDEAEDLAFEARQRVLEHLRQSWTLIDLSVDDGGTAAIGGAEPAEATA